MTITPTYTGCPATFAIEASIRARLDAAGLSTVAIRTVLSPAWTTDMITDAGREEAQGLWHRAAGPECGVMVAANARNRAVSAMQFGANARDQSLRVDPV